MKPLASNATCGNVPAAVIAMASTGPIPERPDRNSRLGTAAVTRCGLRQRSTLGLVARTHAT
jgi:hypothetical protein